MATACVRDSDHENEDGEHFQYLIRCMQVNFNECYFCGLTSTAVIEKYANVSANAYSANVMTSHNHQIASQYNYTEQGNMPEGSS